MSKLPVVESGEGTPALVMLHFLGGSAREWVEVRARLHGRYRCVALDLPGFGGAADLPGYSVAEMADSVAETLAALKLARYAIVGHSMGGKVAAVLARRYTDGLLPGGRLEGLVLVAPSPPGPEPMTDDKRTTMLASLGEVKEGDERRADRFISKNESRLLPPAVQARAVEDVLRMNRSAWVAWLIDGSREDWSERVGNLDLPVLIVAGERDSSLGEKAQREHTLPHFPAARLKVVMDSGHLIPMEKPVELALLLEGFMAGLKVPESYMRFIESERVSPKTREVVLARIPEPQGGPNAFSEEEMDTLRAVLARVIPQAAGAEIDLAARLDTQLATGKGDGWRYAVLPEDLAAYRIALFALDDMAKKMGASRFAGLAIVDQDRLLDAIATPLPNAPQMARWFEDLRADAAAAYMAHPATLARIGYSGIGVGGADTPHRGFVRIGVGVVEDWEPREIR